jgi:serine/threonine-protein kinase
VKGERLSSGSAAVPERWRLLSKLPTGHRTQVWVAEDRQLGERVVLKLFPPCADPMVRARALTEVRLGLLLHHPHLVQLYEVLEWEEHLIAVMELMVGGDLARRVALEGAQPFARVVEWTAEALSALAFLHEQQLIHRDVTASNLLLDHQDRLKLADLGLAGRLDRLDDPAGGTAGVGTPGYMAPEHAAGADPTPAWDLYGLGATLRQLLTGVSPIAERTPAALPESCPRWLCQFVERLLARDPRDRWPTAVEALAVFEAQRTA